MSVMRLIGEFSFVDVPMPFRAEQDHRDCCEVPDRWKIMRVQKVDHDGLRLEKEILPVVEHREDPSSRFP